MGIEYRQKVLALAEQKGPLLPTDVARLMRVETMTAGAMLSEMVENKILKVSTVKVGGSPLYFLPGRTDQLERFSANLKDKDKEVFEELKKRRVLKDSDQEVLTRFSLRQLRDFAKPMHISHGADADLFWRWHAVPEDEALSIISGKRPHIPSQPKQRVKKVKIKKEYDLSQDILYQQLMAYCSKKNYTLQNVKVITKKRDMEGEVLIPHDASFLKHFFKVRDKRSISDTEVAEVYAKGAIRKMPAILFITGALSKKAEVAQKSYPSLIIVKLGSGDGS